MAEYRIKEPQDRYGDVVMEKSTTDARGQQAWKEDLRMHDTTTERDKKIDSLEDWVSEQETTIPDGVVKGIAEIENFLSGTTDGQTLAAMLRELTEALARGIAANTQAIQGKENVIDTYTKGVRIAADGKIYVDNVVETEETTEENESI